MFQELPHTLLSCPGCEMGSACLKDAKGHSGWYLVLLVHLCGLINSEPPYEPGGPISKAKPVPCWSPALGHLSLLLLCPNLL